ncbi:group I intron-associated PD-(D/E)XK endonuclease [Peribacillus butanolivorans]|uniref:PD(D/E)XK endonuclease domain-containing protein n=1 Tax=Peribacillus butanolivorans TaxID=421767 RepID=A0ABM6XMY9_9BACI|nr:group I intron-associated PD-(D/E)XK endonuclease [Peribacillus butanolivorans]AXN39798.1 hypothetical protein DTO10_16480 [Peribacillus butanolivorans]
MYDKHQSGKISEFYVAYELSNLGFDVYFPTGNPRYDLIAEKGNQRYFVQVKSGLRKSEQLKINLRGNSTTKGYTQDDVDLIAIHERSENKVVYLPIEEIQGQVSVCFRYEPPNKIYSHRTRLMENYTKFPLTEVEAV